jgi:hypothetical protein
VGFAPEGIVYYMDETGFPRLLEPADPPNRAELARRQAAKEQRRADNEAATKARNEERRKELR